MMKIILASGSPRRQELLGKLGIQKFDILVPDIDERMDRALSPDKLVETISAEKAKAAAELARDRAPDALVIAADTVVTLDGAVLGKPSDKADAVRMLKELSGRRHQVFTGFTVRKDDQVVSRSVCTEVSFRSLTEREIQNYVQTGEPMDKAGAYGIQGFGAMLIDSIRGDFFNVMGLPVCELGRVLADFGVDCLDLAAR